MANLIPPMCVDPIYGMSIDTCRYQAWVTRLGLDYETRLFAHMRALDRELERFVRSKNSEHLIPYPVVRDSFIDRLDAIAMYAEYFFTSHRPHGL
jgi:hypothetical protein